MSSIPETAEYLCGTRLGITQFCTTLIFMIFNYALSISSVTIVQEECLQAGFPLPLLATHIRRNRLNIYPIWGLDCQHNRFLCMTLCSTQSSVPEPCTPHCQQRPSIPLWVSALATICCCIFQKCLDSEVEFRHFLAYEFSSPMLRFNQLIPLNVQADVGRSFLWSFLWSHTSFSQ